MRVVSDILESNGSSSMATVCGATLSLMDAGVPIVSQVAGIAMGLVKEGEKYAILTDIAGAEDHYGDMDFKVAGTRQGITALQMDIKVTGITAQIMCEAMDQAKRGRLFILDRMAEVMPEPRSTISEYAPRFYTLQIPTDKIRDLIGPGGKVIRGIIEQTGVKIEVEDSGRVNVSSSDQAAAAKALQMIGDITATAETGKTYLGKVSRLADFGAFVEILPGTDGLLHISEVAEHRIKDIRDELKEGDQILVKVLSIEGNRIRLSRKAILKEQRAKMEAGGGAPAMSIEGGEPADFEDVDEVEDVVDNSGEPNFNRADASAAAPAGGRGDRPDRGPGGGGGGRRRRPGGGGGGRGRGGPRGGDGGRQGGRH
jgi:polyribonucleotide nucleotidyltransferase